VLRSSSKSLRNHVVSLEEEEDRLQWEGFAEKEGFKSGMKERVGDGKIIIISMTVSGSNSSSSSSSSIVEEEEVGCKYSRQKAKKWTNS